ncbi:MAG: hypothetical protein ACT4PT_09090 [Methanobacteriota archaeon]
MRPWSVLLAAILVSGCLGASTESAEPLSTLPEELAKALALDASGCDVAGSIGINPLPPGVTNEDVGIPAPFEWAETWEYAGVPEGPVQSPGNWHAAVVCDEWVLGPRHEHMPNFGVVGLAVKPPPFDVGLPSADRHFLVSTVATQDADLTRAVTEAGFFVYQGAGRMYGAEDGEPFAVIAIVETAGDGLYESDMLMERAPTDFERVRFWLIVEDADGSLHPAALDMGVVEGGTYYGKGPFSHTNTGKHPPGGGMTATRPYMGGLGFFDADLEFSLTKVEATLEEKWIH